MTMRLGLALAGVLLLIPSAVQAQDSGRERMLELAAEGGQLFQEERFEEAALTFAEAYDTFPDPNLKKNEMVAWFKAENCGKAIPAGETFLEEGKDITPKDESDVKTVKVQCEIRVANAKLNLGKLDEADAATRRALAADPDPEERAEIMRIQERIEQRRAVLNPRDEPPSPVEPGSEPGRPWTFYAGWGATGAGAAGLVTVLAINLANVNAIHDGFDTIGAPNGCDYDPGDRRFTGEECDPGAVEASPDYQEFNEHVRQQERKLRTAAFISGGVFAAGGAILLYHYLGGSESNTAHVSVGPTVGPGHGGAFLRLRF